MRRGGGRGSGTLWALGFTETPSLIDGRNWSFMKKEHNFSSHNMSLFPGCGIGDLYMVWIILLQYEEGRPNTSIPGRLV